MRPPEADSTDEDLSAGGRLWGETSLSDFDLCCEDVFNVTRILNQ